MIDSWYHPLAYDAINDWELWRYAYRGGRSFIDRYLAKFSQRETDADFEDRKNLLTYCPAFAKAGINEIKNAIFQRLAEVTRLGGPEIYTQLILGQETGIDGAGSSMETFIGNIILPEMLVMGKVGVFVDRAPLDADENGEVTLRTAQGNYPYCYYYPVEQIMSWVYNRRGQLTKLVLCDREYKYDQQIFVPTKDYTEQYRVITLDTKVTVEYYDTSKNRKDIKVIDIPEIPFALFELSDSLMRDIADYQKALLNMASSDVAYILKANFPFYTEQYDQATDTTLRGEYDEGDKTKKEINVGVAHGRRYPKNVERPGFIHPSSEPLTASTNKQKEMMEEIRLLLNLAITNLKPTKAISAEAKAKDEGTLESGLSYIGLALKHGEKQVAKFICNYLKETNIPTINYPEKYSLKTDEERRLETRTLNEIFSSIPSKTFKKEILKRIAGLTLFGKVDEATQSKIENEIDNAEVVVNHENIQKDVETGILSKEVANQLLGYPANSVGEDDNGTERDKEGDTDSSDNSGVGGNTGSNNNVSN